MLLILFIELYIVTIVGSLVGLLLIIKLLGS
jgi:hypothetical protein